MEQIKKIGWIGTGVMGNSMCKHMIGTGYTAYVYNRTKSKANGLINLGANWCNSPAEVAKNSEVIFSIVGYPVDVESTIFGKEGVLSEAKKGTIIVDMTTSDPSLAVRIYNAAKEKNIFSLDAPVSGGDIGAKEATLSIMVGGDKETFEYILPLFKCMGKNISYMGSAGTGQHTKMANQITIASLMVSVVECLLYSYKAGLDLNQVIDAIGSGAAGSWSLNNLGRRIVNGNFNPGFFIKHFIKDMGIALLEAKKMNLSLPGLAMANQFYIAASALGLENMGTQALYKVFERMNNIVA